MSLIFVDDQEIDSTVCGPANINKKANVAEVELALSLKSNITSPTFVGVPKAPKAAKEDDSNQIATTSFVQEAIKDKFIDVDEKLKHKMELLPDKINLWPASLDTENGGFVNFHYGRNPDNTSVIYESAPGNLNVNGLNIDVNKLTPDLTDVSNKVVNTTFIRNLLSLIWPVGSLYFTLNNTCNLAALFGTWELVSSGKALWTGNGSNGGQTLAAGLPQHTHGGTTGNMSANATGGVTNIGTGWGGYNGGGATPVGYGNMSASKTSNAPYNQEDGNHYQMGTGDIANNIEHTHSFTTGNASDSIYGKSTTVQPPAYIINVFKRIL